MDYGCDGKVLIKKISLNIQFFADPDKTEKATPRRRQKSREEGQIPYSKDLAMAAVFLLLIVVMRFVSPMAIESIKKMTVFFVSLPNQGTFMEYDEVGQFISVEAFEVFIWIAVLLLAGFAIAIALGFFQTRFLISLKSLKFDLNRINPLSGFKRLFSLRSVIEFLKNLVKLIILGFIGWSFITGIWNTLFLLTDLSLSQGLEFTGDALFQMSLQIGLALLALGFVDFFYQRWENERSIKMSKKEIKDEMKDIEGNPQIKQKQRQMMAEIMKRRMMEEVPSATVVVTNPTHYAIAIKFEIDKMSVPMLVAKGVDNIALKIREIAEEYGVPIYENPPLARQLYDRVEIGEEIPADLYRAVAEVLAFVMKMAGKV